MFVPSRLMRADVRAIEERHAERDPALLHQLEQALPDALLGPAEEQLRGQPPRAEFGRDAAPLGPVLLPPEDRRDGPAQTLRRRLAARSALFDQRLPDRPSRVREDLAPAPFCHAPNMETAFKP